MQSTEQKLLELFALLVKPQMIYRLQHNALNESGEQYIHWLLVLPDTDNTAFRHYETLIELLRIQQEQLQVILIKETDLLQQVQAGHLYYSLCCNKNNLLYCNHNAATPLKNPENIEEQVTDQADDFYITLTKAKWFLAQAKELFEEAQQHALCSFTLQQSIELALRGFLLVFTGKEYKTHSIIQLLGHCRYIAPGITAVFPLQQEEDRQALQLLEKAYTAARYSHLFSIEPAILQQLLAKTTELHYNLEKTFRRYTQKLLHHGKQQR